ncbi:MAG: tRNA (adenosine(37)-N6)-dimethylallyltransferase MiaA [Prevotellaceae bacterium]|jgi:tRNA dimethylallyltransferase|nr:tRNA (adenosine(37)-N6)-dimethylallyltransferase MiaA [Prevotellaceae bacterium]
MHKHTLIVILGATATGKTAVGLHLAEALNAPVISADSRQLYRELKIGTAAPTISELSRAPHYFIGTQSIHDDTYNAGQYESDVLRLLDKLFLIHRSALLVGGSMMYIDAVCYGIDELPNVDSKTRNFWKNEYKEKGLEYIRLKLKETDPNHFETVDKNNPKRLLHALEICSIAGKPYSDLLTGQKKERPFNILKIGLEFPREELYARIDNRVDQMIRKGLIGEAQKYYPFKQLNALNTVGYKELYRHIDGTITLEEAIDKIKCDSRRYAKRQITWFKKDKDVRWFHPDRKEEIVQYINENLSA